MEMLSLSGFLVSKAAAKGLVLASKLAVCLGMEVPSLSIQVLHSFLVLFLFKQIIHSTRQFSAFLVNKDMRRIFKP